MIEWLTDWNFWRTVVEVVAVTAAGIAAGVAWWRRRKDSVDGHIKKGDTQVMKSVADFRHSNKKRFDRVHERLDQFGEKLVDQSTRITKVEQKVQDLPSHSDLKTIYSQLSTLEAKVAETNATTRQTNHLLQTINTFLIQREI